jgi:sugar phosphate isomerase/epimerase
MSAYLSLSVRIAEGFLSKEEAVLTLAEVAELAQAAAYSALCLRASQVGVHSDPSVIARAGKILNQFGLRVSMLTGDFDVVYNNELGPQSLRKITPYLDLAQTLGAPRIRVALKTEDDIVWAQRAADEAAERRVQLVHQCHTLSLFETIDGIEQTLQRIGRANFGLIYEPANLEICGQPYQSATIERLAPWIFNVYLQNQRLRAEGEITLKTWCCGPVSFDLLQIHESGGIDFPSVFDGLARIGYQGAITVHQSAPHEGSPRASATATAHYLRPLLQLLNSPA